MSEQHQAPHGNGHDAAAGGGTGHPALGGVSPHEAPGAVDPGYCAHNYINHDRGVWSWLTTVDHKRISLIYLGFVLFALFLGGIFAMMVRIEHLTPGRTIMDANTYNRAYTLHGVIMIFMFMIPAIPAIFGNFFLPIMIGAKDVAFPRLNLLSVYVYVVGAVLAVVGMVAGGTDTGWTFYAPYSTTGPTAVFPVLVAAFILGFSSILTGLNFIVTIHTLRAPGMGWMRMPLFVWATYATSVIQVLATPVIGLSVMLVGIEKVFGFGLFDPARGGDPVLFEHFFWFYSHPAVYIMILPAMGVMSEVIGCFSRKNLFGYRMIAYSSLGIAFVGFFAWGHHLFVSGMSSFDGGAFAIITMFIGVFTSIKVFNWIGTLYKGSISMKSPLLYAFGFLFFLFFGGMTGVVLSTVSLDVPWHDTYFIVAHFHFIMVGATIMAFMAALHYWFPKMFGKMYHEGWAFAAGAFIVLGFVATFTPQFFLGNAGMPRRYYFYPEEMQGLHVMSTAGAFLTAFGLVITAINLGFSLVKGRVAGPNPWHSRGYEWLGTSSPPDKHNFTQDVVISHGPHEYQEPGEEPQIVVV